MNLYVFDIDDTILFSEIDENGNYKLKSYDPFIVKKINELYDNGNGIVISTGRNWNHLIITVNQLKNIGLKYHSLMMGKPPATIIDDKAFSPIDFMQRKL